jgi:hypothetical protein
VRKNIDTRNRRREKAFGGSNTPNLGMERPLKGKSKGGDQAFARAWRSGAASSLRRSNRPAHPVGTAEFEVSFRVAAMSRSCIIELTEKASLIERETTMKAAGSKLSEAAMDLATRSTRCVRES